VEVVEPFLMQRGYLQRTPRGRLLTKRAFDHLRIAALNQRGESDASDAEKGRVSGALCPESTSSQR